MFVVNRCTKDGGRIKKSTTPVFGETKPQSTTSLYSVSRSCGWTRLLHFGNQPEGTTEEDPFKRPTMSLRPSAFLEAPPAHFNMHDDAGCLLVNMSCSSACNLVECTYNRREILPTEMNSTAHSLHLQLGTNQNDRSYPVDHCNSG